MSGNGEEEGGGELERGMMSFVGRGRGPLKGGSGIVRLLGGRS